MRPREREAVRLSLIPPARRRAVMGHTGMNNSGEPSMRFGERRSPSWWVGVVLGIIVLGVAATALVALGLQYVYGWFAASCGGRPMPFAVAFVTVFLLQAIFGRRPHLGGKS
jgi:hypothetical protein